jgi:hypothetical protein
LASLFVSALPAALFAAVDLVWVDNDGTNAGWLGAKGATFQLTLNMSSSEATTGLDYYLVSNNGSGFFTITARDFTTSPFSDVYFTNTEVATAPKNALNPQTDLDLGGIVNNVNTANVPGTYLVAKYTFVVSGATPLGTYTIQTVSNPDSGWIGASPNFNESAFNHHASYSITVAAPQWNRDTGASWGTATNWSDNILPSSTTATANFLNRLTVPSTITMDASRTLNVLNIDSPLTYTIARGAGSGTLTMNGTTPSINILSGTQNIQTFITFAAVGSFNVSSGASVLMSTATSNLNWSVNGAFNIATGGSATISGPMTIGAARTLTKAGDGTLTLSGVDTANAGAIFSATAGQTNFNSTYGAAATAAAAASANLTLNVSGTGQVDLNADQFLKGINITFSDPGLQSLDLNTPPTLGAFRSLRVYATDLVAAQASIYSAITNALANPGDGLFDTGIANHLGARLAVVKRPDLHGDQNLLVRPAATGDLNLDGSVSISDFIDLASNFGATGASWAEGDLNYDGAVTISDFIDLASNFGASYSGEVFPISPEDSAKLAEFAAAHGASVPEPGLLGLIGIGILLSSRRRTFAAA